MFYSEDPNNRPNNGTIQITYFILEASLLHNNFVIKNLNNAYILRQTFYGKLVTLYHLDISLKKITFAKNKEGQKR